MRAALLALVMAGCGEVHFVDPNPPRLFRASIAYTSTAVDEPVVWIPIFNLFFEDASGCAWAKGATLSLLQQGFSGASAQQLQLAPQDLSPDCLHRGERPLDLAGIGAQFDSAQATYPRSHVRPIIVYIDDVDLLVSAETLTALRTLRSRSDPGPLLWTVSLASVSVQLGPDRAVAWSFAGDGALAGRLASVVKADLPLQSTPAPDSGPVPLLSAAQLETTREFKLCTAPDAKASNYPLPGVAHALDRAHPPTITFALPQSVATPKSAFQTSTFEAEVEGCTGNCDRYYIGAPGADPIRWDEANRCLVGNG